MSDIFNGSNDGSNEPKSAGTYSYTKDEINQGESHYQWTPYDDGLKRRKFKRQDGFVAKIFRTAALAAVFGLVVGLTFQTVVYISGRVGFGYKQESTSQSSSAGGSGGPIKTETATNTAVSTNISTDVSEITQSVLPAIVQVTNVGLQEYQTFFGTFQQEQTSAGSGIIIDQDENNIYIATNNHVVAGAETLTITFNDGEAVEGTIKGTDSSCDLAVVSVAVKDIKAETLSAIKLATQGDSDKTVVGEPAIVIGNAMGFGTSVTNGIISAVNREMSIPDDQGNIVTNTLIQTSAAVNPGNSGGALLNAKGELIGIVSAKLVDERTEGMGYAIPISYASEIITRMIKNDEVSELDASFIGIMPRDIDAALSEKYGVPMGVRVEKVIEGSGAEKAGIEEKDIITALDGRKVNSKNTLDNIMKYIPAGSTVDITVAKAKNDYKEETYKITLTHKVEEIK
ncbi:MAG: trypsin-like peptidase domain-containing protein [Pseudobutyrivibrio sp.]|nr:trypsin-like peptidase domain-containing protein [Pseudobutyrivibrio sp.]